MAAHETFFQILFEILGVTITDYSVENLIASFFLPLIIMSYAVYLLFEKIKIFPRTNIVSIVFGVIISLLSLRLGNLAFWIGVFGIFALRLRGAFTKFLGLAVVFALYTQISTLISTTTLGPVITAVILLAVLYILDRSYSWSDRVFYIAAIAVGYWYLSPLLVGQIPVVANGIWIAAFFAIVRSLHKARSPVLKIVLTAGILVTAYFLTQMLLTQITL